MEQIIFSAFGGYFLLLMVIFAFNSNSDPSID